jgi:hypothetical protein
VVADRRVERAQEVHSKILYLGGGKKEGEEGRNDIKRKEQRKERR